MEALRQWLAGWKLFLNDRRWPANELRSCRIADAVFVPGLCITEDKTRLTIFNREAITYAAELLNVGVTEKIIYSTNVTEEIDYLENKFRTELLLELGVGQNKLLPLRQSWNSQTQDEVEGLRRFLKEHPEIITLKVVTDSWQMPRLIFAMKRIIPRPEIEVTPMPIRFSRFERSAEHDAAFGTIKPLLISNRMGWAARNIVGYLLTPFLIRKWTKPLRQSSIGK